MIAVDIKTSNEKSGSPDKLVLRLGKLTVQKKDNGYSKNNKNKNYVLARKNSPLSYILLSTQITKAQTKEDKIS